MLTGLTARRRRLRMRRPGRSLPMLVAALALTVTATALAGRVPAPRSPGAHLAAASCAPKILTVGSFAIAAQQTVVITGRCFGSFHATHATDSRYLRISDLTQRFNACSSRDRPLPDLLTCDIDSWTDRRITFGGFAGDTARYGILLGDTLRVQVWNASTGAGPAACRVRVSAAPAGDAATRCAG